MKPLAKGAIADLIVVLDAEDEGRRRFVGNLRPSWLAGRRRGMALKDKPFVDRLRDRVHAPAEIGVIIFVGASQVDAKIVMEVVGPDRVKPVPSDIPRADRADIV